MQTKLKKLQARQRRVRGKLRETGSRPRLSVFRSSAHIWAQIIDDQKHLTLAAANDLTAHGTKIEKAQAVGTAVAKLALKKKCSQVIFDRGAYRYHGRIKALADAARQEGLSF